jgi:hypothetical protein
MDAATILELVAARIEALTPAEQTSVDDRFQCTIGNKLVMSGPRQTLLGADAGIRKPVGGDACSEWETTITIVTAYAETPPEDGQRGVFGLALEDSEAIVADLYLWSSTTPSILSIEPEPGTVDGDGQGVLLAERSVFVRYIRS